MTRPSMTIKEAAERLDIPQQLLRLCLQEGRFPFGAAVKRRRWAYYINRGKLEGWIDTKNAGGEA